MNIQLPTLLMVGFILGFLTHMLAGKIIKFVIFIIILLILGWMVYYKFIA